MRLSQFLHLHTPRVLRRIQAVRYRSHAQVEQLAREHPDMVVPNFGLHPW